MNPVVVSGLGVVTCFGAGHEPLLAALECQGPRLSTVEDDGGYHLPKGSRVACRVDPTDLRDWLAPRAARRMSPPSRLAVVAARIAARAAGVEPADDDAVEVALGTSFGPSTNTEKLLRQIHDEGPASASPMLFTESVANAPAAQVALLFGARGSNITVTQRGAGALAAVGAGVRDIALGRARTAFVGGVDELNPLLHAILDRFHVLARPKTERTPATARPFDRHRTGAHAGEGASVLVLEDEQHASQRGVSPRVRVLGCAGAFDPSAGAATWGREPARLVRDLEERRDRFVDQLRAIDVLVTNADGSPAGDGAHAEVISHLWPGSERPVILAPQAVTGTFCGLPLAVGVLAAEGRSFGPTHGFREPDVEHPVTPWMGAAAAWEVPQRVAVQCLAVGGAARWLILERTG